MQKLELTGIVYFFPWILQNTDLLIKGFWEKFLQSRDRIQGMIKQCIQDHKDSFDDSNHRDFIDVFISQWKKTKDPKSSFYGEEGGIKKLFKQTLTKLFD